MFRLKGFNNKQQKQNKAKRKGLRRDVFDYDPRMKQLIKENRKRIGDLYRLIINEHKDKRWQMEKEDC